MDECITMLKGASVEDIDAAEEAIEDLEGELVGLSLSTTLSTSII